MIFDIGDPNNPKGNVIFYTNVHGHNPFFPGYRIFASNVMISVLPSDKEAQIASFPPVGIDDYETLYEIAEKKNCDLVKQPDFELPSNKALQPAYLNNRVNDFNDMVNDYFKRYTRRRKSDNKKMDEYQRINYFGQLSMEVRGMVEHNGSHPQIERYIKQMEDIKRVIRNRAHQHSMGRVIDVIRSDKAHVSDLIDLYIRLIVAVHKEEYADAESIKRDIETIEQELAV